MQKSVAKIGDIVPELIMTLTARDGPIFSFESKAFFYFFNKWI
jgi:hypothetical protein